MLRRGHPQALDRRPPVLPGPGGRPSKAVRTFGAMTADLLGLADWLAEAGVTHVARESAGVYGKSVWNQRSRI